MRTQKQIEASRANGARSRGPVTAAGKHRSSQNSRTHGVHSAIKVPATELPHFPALLAAFNKEYAPATPREAAVVHALAAARARALQLQTLEKTVWDHQITLEHAASPTPLTPIDAATRAYDHLRPAFTALLRYEVVADRRFFKALAWLQKEGHYGEVTDTTQPQQIKAQTTTPTANIEKTLAPNEPAAAPAPPALLTMAASATTTTKIEKNTFLENEPEPAPKAMAAGASSWYLTLQDSPPNPPPLTLSTHLGYNEETGIAPVVCLSSSPSPTQRKAQHV